MNKKIIIIPIVIIIGIFAVMSLDSSEKNDNIAFHVTLADPQLYENGIYTESFDIKMVNIISDLFQMEAAPEILSISLDGYSIKFSEDFQLKNTLHKTGISEYYTWEYLGENKITILEDQRVSININPNGNVMGSVSVDILQN